MNQFAMNKIGEIPVKKKRKKLTSNLLDKSETQKHRCITYELSSFFLNLSTEELIATTAS